MEGGSMLESSFDIFSIIAVIVPILVVCIFIFTFAMMFSPKLRAKMMSRQIKFLKHMVDYSKEDLENIITNMGDISVSSTKNIINENEKELKDIVEKSSDLGSIAVEKTARAIKIGLEDNLVYCKYCGKTIDSDSRFCKNCGKEV